MRLRRETGDFTLAFPKGQKSITIAKNLKPVDFLGMVVDMSAFGGQDNAGDEYDFTVVGSAGYALTEDERSFNLDLIQIAGSGSYYDGLAEYVPSTGVFTFVL